MREEAVVVLLDLPRRSFARPRRAQLASDEAGANAEHAVVARDRVGAEEEDQVARTERKAAATRLAGGERVGAPGAPGKQAAQRFAIEVMEEEVRNDEVPAR